MWKDWLSFSRREQYGIIALSFLLFLLVALKVLMVVCWKPPVIQTGKVVAVELKSNENDNVGEEEQKDKLSYDFKFFDPNRVTVTELDKMGLPDYIIINWMKYLEAGGSFNEPQEIAKIYGLDSVLAKELSKYVVFTENKKLNEKQYRESKAAFKYSSLSTLEGREDISDYGASSIDVDTFIIDLNSATASELKRIRGIGNVLSQRIIDFRELLGGFYTKEQIKEVYGISEDLYNNISHHFVVQKGVYRKISVNKASIFILRKHPYLNFYQARDIIEYRKNNGPISSKQQLKSISSIDEETLKKLLPYIDFSIEEQKIEN